MMNRAMFLLTVLVLNACSGLSNTGPSVQSPTQAKDSSVELDAQSLARARAMISPITLRVETDRYQSELFFKNTQESAETERRTHWLEAQLQMAGLKPAGDTLNSWRQRVNLTAYRSESTLTTTVKGNNKTFSAEQGVELWSTTPLKEIRIDRSEITFVGADSFLEIDSANTIDLRGKVILMPEPPRSKQMSRLNWAAHQGAVALIFIKQGFINESHSEEGGIESTREHYILRTAMGHPDVPLVMGRISEPLALSLFGISNIEKKDSNADSSHNKINQSGIATGIRFPIHLVVKNTWRDCWVENLMGKISGQSDKPNGGKIVFHTRINQVDPRALGASSWQDALHFSALMNTARALSQPGETPQKDILFVITTHTLESHQSEQENLAWKSWKLQSTPLQTNSIEINFNHEGSLSQRSFDNNEAWLKLAKQVQMLLEKGYVQAGPWQHH
jgi:hypothetical protein